MSYTLEADDKVLTATEEQCNIIDFARDNPHQNLLINALAGAAKTSTLRFLCKYLSIEPTLSLAFNKKIADEMGRVLPGHVRCSTMNSIGHRVWGSTIGKRLTVDTRKTYNIVQAAIEALPARQLDDAYDQMSDIMKAVQRAKLSGYIPPGVPQGRSLLTEGEFFGALDEEPDAWFVGIVNDAIAESVRQSYEALIDFDDQIYMPVLFGGSFPTFARVMGDEAQDFSPLNQAMIERLIGPDTWLVAVGDPNQSIYAFRGANTRSMHWLRQRFDMHEMPLSVSFRCPIEGVRNAHWRAPQMRAPSWAIQGSVTDLGEWDAQSIPDDSAIICRNNAPLLTCALALLRARRGIHLIGTDLGPQLTRSLKKLSPNLNLPQERVYAEIDLWEREKLARSRNAGSVIDRADCLRVFAGFGPTLGAAVAACEHLFKAAGPIQLLSGHKSKGLEWDVVYHLDPHRIPSPWSKEGEAYEQEMNLRYVIETRFKRDLYRVRMDGFAS